MNKNIKALQDYTEALMKPDFSFEGISKLMGAINQIHYGVNTNEKAEIPKAQNEDEPADERTAEDYGDLAVEELID